MCACRVTDHLVDLLQYNAELHVGGLREIDDGTRDVVVMSCVEQLGEQSVFVRVSLHHSNTHAATARRHFNTAYTTGRFANHSLNPA